MTKPAFVTADPKDKAQFFLNYKGRTWAFRAAEYNRKPPKHCCPEDVTRLLVSAWPENHASLSHRRFSPGCGGSVCMDWLIKTDDFCFGKYYWVFDAGIANADVPGYGKPGRYPEESLAKMSDLLREALESLAQSRSGTEVVSAEAPG